MDFEKLKETLEMETMLRGFASNSIMESVSATLSVLKELVSGMEDVEVEDANDILTSLIALRDTILKTIKNGEEKHE